MGCLQEVLVVTRFDTGCVHAGVTSNRMLVRVQPRVWKCRLETELQNAYKQNALQPTRQCNRTRYVTKSAAARIDV